MAAEKMHDDEFEVTPELVRRLLREQMPQWAGLQLSDKPLRGTDNALYRLGDDMVARFPRIHWAVDAIPKEFEWLPRLAERLPLEIPVPLALGEPGAGYPWPWSVYSWLDGDDLVAQGEIDRDAFLDDVVQFIQALRSVEIAGSPSGRSGFPLRKADRSVQDAIARLPGRYDREPILHVWRAALEVPEWSGLPVWVHADLDGRNLLARDGRLSAVIDWGSSGLGDPAFDASSAWKLFGSRARAEFKSQLELDQDTWERGRGLALALAVMALSYYTEANNLALLQESDRVVSAILGD